MNNDPTTHSSIPTVARDRPPATFDRRVHMMLNLYVVVVLAYVSYSLATRSGLMRLWLICIDAGWMSVAVGSGRGIVFFFVTTLALLLLVFPASSAARRFWPPLALAMDTWGRSQTPRSEVQSWRSIFKVTGAIALFFGLVAPLIFWATQSEQARKIHEIDLRDPKAAVPMGANYVRLNGVVARRFWLVYGRKDGGNQGSIAPLVGERWTPAEPVRYFIFASGEDPPPFRERGLVHISGEPGRLVSDIERQAMERYRSAGLKIGHPYFMLESKELPKGGYAPVDYETLIDSAGLGIVVVLAAFFAQVVGRYNDKHKVGRYITRLR